MRYHDKSKKILVVTGILIVLIGIIAVYSGIFFPASSGFIPPPKNPPYNDPAGTIPEQTESDNAQQLVDSNGVPFLHVTDLGDVRNPANVARYAFGYAGIEPDSHDASVEKNTRKFQNCISWLKENMKQTPEGQYVWYYPLNNTFHDVTVDAPWYSALGQATGIEALLESYNVTGNPDDLNRARQAAEVLFTPIDQGGLLYQKGEDIWFEEVPVPRDNPPHTLNGHMRTLIAIKKLYTTTGNERYLSYYRRGLSTLERWLPLYDNGYWLRYDLNPEKTGLCFRFTNPYGYNLTQLAIDAISLTDPLTNETVTLDVGSAIDAEGKLRIAGNDWGQRDSLDGRTVRRLMPVQPSTYREDSIGSFTPPATYFYLSLPSAWKDNLRSDMLEMTVRYKDEQPANVMIQMRSIAPGPAFQNLRDGDLLVTGSGQWREWKIPLRSTDLGYRVGVPYAEKHTYDLETLGHDSPVIGQWAVAAKGYEILVKNFSKEDIRVVHSEPVIVPPQTPTLPVYSFDQNGVVMFYLPNDNTTFINGYYLHNYTHPELGEKIYSPWLVSSQLLTKSAGAGGVLIGLNLSDERREPALQWLLSDKNYKNYGGAIVYPFTFSSTYNDVVSPAPWQSAFGQASVIKAFEYAIDTKMSDVSVLRDYLLKSVFAFDLRVDAGGFKTSSRTVRTFFEEVPQKSHILNADILSINQINQSQQYVHNDSLSLLGEQAVKDLKNVLYLYDTGYWLKYDQNPKKEFLFQIDWIRGNSSPLIDEIILENPQTQNCTVIDVGAEGIVSSYPSISGTDWKSRELVDFSSVRGFENGYLKRSEIVQGGTQHNVYFLMPLPDRNITDGFDIPQHKISIRYKDIAEGEFSLKIQVINEGNYLSFVPLQNSMITCTGDQQWKTATILLRPQDMGWYVGSEYQKYHIDQLYELANRTGDWSIRQSAEKQEYYLKAKENYVPVVITPVSQNQIVITNLAKGAHVVNSSPMVQNHSIQDLINQKQNNTFAEAATGTFPQNFTLDLGKPYKIYSFDLIWENETSFGDAYKIFSINSRGETQIVKMTDSYGMHQSGKLHTPVLAQKIRFELYDTQGPKRLFLRQFQLFGEKIIDEPLPKNHEVAKNASMISSSPPYPGYGIENMLDIKRVRKYISLSG
jgi:hypothetical protein